MKLSHFSLTEPLSWEKGRACTLVIEAPTLYRKLSAELLEQAAGQSGNFTISQDNFVYDMERSVDVITDPLRTDPGENKKLITAMIKEVASVALHELPVELNDLYGRISETLSAAVFAADAEACFQPLSELSGLLKLCDLKPDTADCSLLEKLILHMELAAKYLRKKLFVIFHLHGILTEREMEKFLRELHSRELLLLMIETHLPYRTAAEQIRIIDRDLCEIF